MVAASDAAESPAGLPKTPISFRLGDLEPEVTRRKRVAEGAVATIRRDLTRYYMGARVALQRFDFDNNEAYILCHALRHARLDANTARFLWAAADEWVRDKRNQAFFRPNTVQSYERGLSVVEQLRGISPLDALAILDAVEIYWEHFRHNGGDISEAMEASQLSTEPNYDSDDREDES